MQNTDAPSDLAKLFPESLHKRVAERVQEAIFYCLAFETANLGVIGEIELSEDDLACRFDECVAILMHCRLKLRWSPERTLRWLPELLAETFIEGLSESPQHGEQDEHQGEADGNSSGP